MFACYSSCQLLFYQVATQFSSRGWLDPVPDCIQFGEVPGIKPATSCLVVRHINHSTNVTIEEGYRKLKEVDHFKNLGIMLTRHCSTVYALHDISVQ